MSFDKHKQSHLHIQDIEHVLADYSLWAKSGSHPVFVLYLFRVVEK